MRLGVLFRIAEFAAYIVMSAAGVALCEFIPVSLLFAATWVQCGAGSECQPSSSMWAYSCLGSFSTQSGSAGVHIGCHSGLVLKMYCPFNSMFVCRFNTSASQLVGHIICTC